MKVPMRRLCLGSKASGTSTLAMRDFFIFTARFAIYAALAGVIIEARPSPSPLRDIAESGRSARVPPNLLSAYFQQQPPCE
eukprot:6187501-Pleurochrysis_carterae.AAC.2